MMNPNNPTLYYLNRRQLGYDGIRKNVYEMVIDQIGYKVSKKPHYHTGNIFACKFSRNKNNLHLLGCSTEHGEIVIQPALNDCDVEFGPISRSNVHNNAIFNFAWAEPEMKLVTACGDQTSKLFSVTPSGALVEIKMFSHNSSVKTVMFCPGSSDVFCGGAHDGSIKIWDARLNNDLNVLDFDCKIPNAHAFYGQNKKKPSRAHGGISAVLYTNDLTVISSSLTDGDIKVWDLRKTYRNVKSYSEPLPLMKYYHGEKRNSNILLVGIMDMITNPQLTRLYASGVNDVIYCYSLESTDNDAICQFSGHFNETKHSKISISNDGHYLFSGCCKKTGVIWNTDFPCNEEPMLKLTTKDPEIHELSCSDWCADQTCMKLATTSDALPNIWTIRPTVERDDLETETIRTSSHRLQLPSKVFTVPIKLDAVLKEKYEKETEKNMENWDTTSQIKEQNVRKLPVTPNKPWKILLSKTSPSCSQVSPKRNTRSTQSSPVTPTSTRKRKKSCVSPKNLIDHYFTLNNKREKLDSVNEHE